uniref:protein O-GlcNAcase n=2 Tax=Timema TaxID=61471 RepID=A0A7R9PGU8_TIMGE|nr:unnamed protein product [Timema genevievae]
MFASIFMRGQTAQLKRKAVYPQVYHSQRQAKQLPRLIFNTKRMWLDNVQKRDSFKYKEVDGLFLEQATVYFTKFLVPNSKNEGEPGAIHVIVTNRVGWRMDLSVLLKLKAAPGLVAKLFLWSSMDNRAKERLISEKLVSHITSGIVFRLKKWGMDSYLYAPKDDYKHRAYWRELYTVEEAEHLTGLISSAVEHGITFYYALSPGLDITYSSAKEVAALKRKLEQVSRFGCTAFALLFDDIEPEMSEADKEVFQSFAHAQVSVSNEVFQHLGQPRFMLCPTQYCAARATPNVQNSEYLNTLGAKLAPEIDIMWTGPKVISRILTVESIEEITDVLRRPPVIWDNIHANDYDQKRVFLGPYSGRSPDLIPKLRGVLTNPNCEYGANFVAIHTLAQWSRCNVDGKRDPTINDTVSADIKLETETEDGGVGEDVPSTLSPNMYHPRQALRNAINEWLPEFFRPRAVWGPIAKPQQVVAAAVPIPIIPSVNTCMSLTTTTTSCSSATLPLINSNQLQALAEVCSSVTTSISKATLFFILLPFARCEKALTHEDLALLCDLFYLPFEHGGQGIQLLQEFNWLKSNAHLVTQANKKGKESPTEPEVTEWFERATRLEEISKAVNLLFQHLTFVPNRELLYDLYPYMWDMRGVISLLNSYIKWLGFSKGWKETFMSGEQEPWVFRGGLTADLQRLIPVDSGNDLFVYKPPDVPSSKIYTIRPYLPMDESNVYDVLVGGFLSLSGEFCFVVEDEVGLVGYALAALDAKQFHKKLELAWLPDMCDKYPSPNKTADQGMSRPEELMSWFHTFKGDVPESIHSQHPSVMCCSLLSTVLDQSVAKRMITCLLAALRANGQFPNYKKKEWTRKRNSYILTFATPTSPKEV